MASPVSPEEEERNLERLIKRPSLRRDICECTDIDGVGDGDGDSGSGSDDVNSAGGDD